MAKLLRIKDNSSRKKSDFSDIKNLTNLIADKTLKKLEQDGIFVFPDILEDTEDITKDQMILRSRNGEYCTGNVMGFIGCGDERLIIESRFSGEGDDYFLQYLLTKVMDCPNIVDLESDINSDNRLFNFMLFLFPYYLKTAMQKGLFKKYILSKYNDGNVKGIIDIPRHIKKNTPFIGKVAYNQREFSYDNSLTELVRHTIEYIKRNPYGNTLLTRVKDEVRLVINATPGYKINDRQKIIEENKKNPIRHAYFREYLALQRLCILILRHQKHQIGYGTRQKYGILFEGSWLWEEYVNSLIEDMFYHPRNKARNGVEKHVQQLFTEEKSGKLFGEIIPDFISRNDKPRVIADAKYKPIKNIKGRDFLQVLAYMFRFEANTGYYLYPEAKDDNEDQTLWLNSGTTFEKNVKRRPDNTSVTKHGLKIPENAKDFDDFVEKMKASEENFKQEFKKVFADSSLANK